MAQGVQAGATGSWGDLWYVARLVRGGWGRMLMGLALGAGAAAMGALWPLMPKAMVDYALMGMRPGWADQWAVLFGWLSSVEGAVAAMALLGAGAGALGTSARYVIIGFQQGALIEIQGALFERVLRFPPRFFRDSRTGYLMSRVTEDVLAIEALFSETLLHVAGRGLYVLAGLWLVAALSARVAVVVLVTLPLFAAVTLYYSGRLYEASMRELEGSAVLGQDLQEVIGGAETVKAFAAENREAGRMAEGARTLAGLRARRMVLGLMSGHAATGVAFVGTLCVIWAGALEVRGGAVSIGDYVALTGYAVALTAAVRTLCSAHLMMQPLMAAASRLRELFTRAMEDEIVGGGAPPDYELVPWRGAPSVAFEGVRFSYEPGAEVLGGVSFEVPGGGCAALVGPSGSGKTTCVDLLLRFLEPSAGRILIGGRDIRDMGVRGLREAISVVSQDVFLFAASIADNIRYGRPGAPDAEVREAALRAGLAGEIERMPGGYGAMAGERGVRLSAGQRQRLSLARALLKDTPLMVLDEPSSALDRASEDRLIEALAALKGAKTVLVISHSGRIADMAGTRVRLGGG